MLVGTLAYYWKAERLKRTEPAVDDGQAFWLCGSCSLYFADYGVRACSVLLFLRYRYLCPRFCRCFGCSCLIILDGLFGGTSIPACNVVTLRTSVRQRFRGMHFSTAFFGVVYTGMCFVTILILGFLLLLLGECDVRSTVVKAWLMFFVDIGTVFADVLHFVQTSTVCAGVLNVGPVNEAGVAAAEGLVKALQLDGFDCRQFENPVLQRYAGLEGATFDTCNRPLQRCGDLSYTRGRVLFKR